MRKIFYFVAAAAVLIGGCDATMPRRLTAADDPTNACYATLYAGPKLDVLKPRLADPSKPNSPSVDQISSKDRPTAEEKQAIKSWAEARRSCNQEGAEFRAKHAPVYYRLATEEQNDAFVVLLANLYSDQITYGQFIQQRSGLSAETRRKLEAGVRNGQADLAQREQVNAARQAQVNNALLLLQAAQPQPAPIAPFRPQINCTSRNMAGTVQTNCW
ncbi:MAG: hypothetical protein EON54_03765 [Alcaligenaceae bacterium]|nr:MAG: hypothetical protein EON54_03765 [Alcaligenaceae bacterium]